MVLRGSRGPKAETLFFVESRRLLCPFVMIDHACDNSALTRGSRPQASPKTGFDITVKSVLFDSRPGEKILITLSLSHALRPRVQARGQYTFQVVIDVLDLLQGFLMATSLTMIHMLCGNRNVMGKEGERITVH